MGFVEQIIILDISHNNGLICHTSSGPTRAASILETSNIVAVEVGEFTTPIPDIGVEDRWYLQITGIEHLIFNGNICSFILKTETTTSQTVECTPVLNRFWAARPFFLERMFVNFYGNRGKIEFPPAVLTVTLKPEAGELYLETPQYNIIANDVLMVGGHMHRATFFDVNKVFVTPKITNFATGAKVEVLIEKNRIQIPIKVYHQAGTTNQGFLTI